MGAQVGLGEGDRQGGVGGEVEGAVAFAPVSASAVSGMWGGWARWLYLITAMLTGAYVLVRYTSSDAIVLSGQLNGS